MDKELMSSIEIMKEVINEIDRKTLEFEAKQKGAGVPEKYHAVLDAMEKKYLRNQT